MITERQSSVDPSIFRAYDIRGIVGQTLTQKSIFLIGKAISSLVREGGEDQVAIARDGRTSGPMLIEALAAGICSAGCDVIDVGMVPTPLLYYATHVLDKHSGIMLTGSHNPADYNGLKMVIKGTTLAEKGISDLYQRIVDQRFHEGHGVRHELEVVDRYISHVTLTVFF